MLFEFLLAEGTVVLEPVSVGRTADNVFAGRAQCRCFLALPHDIVEDDDVGPVDV